MTREARDRGDVTGPPVHVTRSPPVFSVRLLEESASASAGQELLHPALDRLVQGVTGQVAQLVLELLAPGLAARPADVTADGPIEGDEALRLLGVVDGQPVTELHLLARFATEQLPLEAR